MSVSINIGHTPNYATVYVGSLRLEFSYQTVIAFYGPDDSAVSVNAWGPTTGKHLNRVDGGDKANRVERDEFTRRLDAQLSKIGLS
ncbi:hypothetical protein SEA_WATERT_120 [Microbacterium phage WaterT]|nr:hypothetical protein SEA_WATERT_120 [Microbacterium phage WaterT]